MLCIWYCHPYYLFIKRIIMKKYIEIGLYALLTIVMTGCDYEYAAAQDAKNAYNLPYKPIEGTDIEKFIDHSEWQTTQYVTYDGSWRKIKYPGGDVPSNIGVCTDVIIRAFRAINIDLQQLIHEDMIGNLSIYNKRYKTKEIDPNIDHRRTQNIQTYLTRIGAKPIKIRWVGDLKPGDIVFYKIAAGHVGIVTDEGYGQYNHEYYKISHNIGGGPELEHFYMEPYEIYRLDDSVIKKMQANCSYSYANNK